MTEYSAFLVHSLEKVLPDMEPQRIESPVLLGFLNETLSVQIAYSCINDDFCESDTDLWIEIDSALSNSIRFRYVGLVPCNYPCHGTTDDNYLSTKPGLFPDLLVPVKQSEHLKAIPSQWRSVWVDITAPAGIHNISLVVSCRQGEIARLHLTANVSEKELPKQTLIHTEWFHADCLADYYQVPVFSEAHWQIIDNYITSAVSHGINMLLTPVFTPPLDTAVGGERTTVQLIKISYEQGVYRFDFSPLERWIAICEKRGIEYLEIAHLFSQWGAVYAPKIVVCVNGQEKSLFGWHTSAVSKEYVSFLHVFLPALKQFLRECGWLNKTFFHISDEPHMKEIETYLAAKREVEHLLSDCKVIDAISDYDVFCKGVTNHPIVSVDHIHDFIEAGVRPLWAYYCTIQAIHVPNRFMAMPATRNRILGVLLYYYNIDGFLHWGFNFYNSRLSFRHINPYIVTDADESFPSGDPFLVYPASNGTAYESLRGVILKQALCDLRALQLCERTVGRSAVIHTLDSLFGRKMSFSDYPHDTTFFDDLRRQIHSLV